MSDDLRIVKYIVIVGEDLDMFIDEVQEAIEDDWEPFGNLVVSHVAQKVFFYQPMVEREV